MCNFLQRMQAAGSHEFAFSFSLLSSGIIWSFRQVICHSRCHLDSEEKQTQCHSGWRVTHRSNCSGDLIAVWGKQMMVLSVLVPTRTHLAAFTPDEKQRAGKQTGVNLSWSSQIVWQHLRTIVGAEWIKNVASDSEDSKSESVSRAVRSLLWLDSSWKAELHSPGTLIFFFFLLPSTRMNVLL